MPSITRVLAPAKINLFLHVIGQRADGYHELQTVFKLINLYDELEIRRLDTPDIHRTNTLNDIPEAEDLCIKAAKLLQRHTNCHLGASITLTKRIPSGAGLGGGSSDAASTLTTLNKLWELHLSQAQLMDLGTQLGADVPIFILGQSAFAEGIGEKLTPLTLPKKYYAIIKPCDNIATPMIFNHPRLTSRTKPIIISDFAQQQKENKGLFGQNDLQSIVFEEFPNIARIAHEIQVLNSNNIGAEVRMSGTGSSLFIEFDSEEIASCIVRQIQAKIDGISSVWLCHSL